MFMGRVRKPPGARDSAVSLNRPTLSVTVTNYNYARFLDQNIESIRSQSFDDFEIILIDNASTDESVDIMRKHAAIDPRVRVIAHAENVGQIASLRESCDLCRGQYRLHVDADDWVLSPDAFKDQVQLLEKNPSMALVYSSLALVDADGRLLSSSHPYAHDVVLPSEIALEQMVGFNLNHSGMMFRLDRYRATDGYTEAYPHMCDVALAVRLSKPGDLVGYIDRPLYAFRQHGANLHLKPHLQIVKREVLPVIALAFDGALGSRLADRSAVKRRAIRNGLVHFPTQHIFSGQLRIGWQLYWESVKLRPRDTIFQGRTLALVARTLFGSEGYRRLVSMLDSHTTILMPTPA
jgi:glycosyltransferase involved in cell wall biosynthesis